MTLECRWFEKKWILKERCTVHIDQSLAHLLSITFVNPSLIFNGEFANFFYRNGCTKNSIKDENQIFLIFKWNNESE
jgi:hypothetical protein